MKIALFGGLVLASPVILFQIWRFVTPGLKATERRYAIPFVLSAFVLFLLGAATAYITLPHALGWLKSVGGPNLQAIYDPIPYLGLILLMMTIFGLTFEFPVVLVSLELARVVTPARLLRSWRWAVIIIVVVAAVFTPELGPVLHVRARHPARRLLLPLHRHREAARALTAFPWPVQETAGAAEFEADLPFALDDFQHEAFHALGLRALGAGVRPDRVGQDAGGGLCRPPGPVGPRQGLLHHAAQGALEPEVRRARRLLRRGARRAADR